jgi:hypothetical protein
VYETRKDDLSPETKETIEAYLVAASKWTNLNKSKIGDYNHKYYDIFKSIQTDLNGIDELVAKLITPIHNNTLYNWLGYFKSSDAFYNVKGQHKIENESDLEIERSISLALINAKKSVKTEKLAGYHLYIISGNASNDYVENGSGEYYKSKAELAINKKDLDLLAPSGKYDGMTNGSQKLLLFATANGITKSQDVFRAMKKEPDANIVFVYAPTFNQKYNTVNTNYNGKKAQQHGTSFLKQFNNDFNYEEIGDFNLLPFMSLINNVEIPEDKGLLVSDFLRMNPFAYGTDTYSTYKSLRDINEYSEPEKTEKLQEFFIDYLNKITGKLSMIKDGFKLDTDTEEIIMNTQRVLLGILNNFNKSNLPNELPNEMVLKKLVKSIVEYNTAVYKIGEESKISNEIKHPFLRMIRDEKGLVQVLKDRNSSLNIKYEKRIDNVKEQLTEYNAKEYFNMFTQEFNIPASKAKILVDIIKVRQTNTKYHTFSYDGLGNNYAFFLSHKDLPQYNKIFNFIDGAFNYNDPAIREGLKEQLNLLQENVFEDFKEDLSISKKIELVWSKITDGSYKINTKFLEFIKKIEDKGEEGLSVYEAYKTPFHKQNIEYKETQQSYFKNSYKSLKTEAHHKLMMILELYDFKCNDGWHHPNITSKKINERLDEFLTKKSKPSI